MPWTVQSAFMIAGKSVGLRPLQTEDVWLLYKWFNDERVLEGLGRKHGLFCVTLEEEKRVVERKVISVSERDFIIVTTAEARAIGLASLSGIDQRGSSAELAVIIGEKEEWGKGYGRDAVAALTAHAFNVLNLHRLYLRVPVYNERAVACFASCGFQREGVLRDDHYHKGAFQSSLAMSALRTDRAGP